jgi:hypothetical protein
LNLKWLEGVSDRVITQHSKEDHMSVIGPSCNLPSAWPLLEPVVFKTLGIVKKKAPPQGG